MFSDAALAGDVSYPNNTWNKEEPEIVFGTKGGYIKVFCKVGEVRYLVSRQMRKSKITKTKVFKLEPCRTYYKKNGKRYFIRFARQVETNKRPEDVFAADKWKKIKEKF